MINRTYWVWVMLLSLVAGLISACSESSGPVEESPYAGGYQTAAGEDVQIAIGVIDQDMVPEINSFIFTYRDHRFLTRGGLGIPIEDDNSFRIDFRTGGPNDTTLIIEGNFFHPDTIQGNYVYEFLNFSGASGTFRATKL